MCCQLATVIFLDSSIRVSAHVLSRIQFVDLSGATLDLHWICSEDGTLCIKEPQNKITVLEQTQKMEKKVSRSGRRAIVGMS